MTVAAAAVARSLAFGSTAGGVWGAAWLSSGEEPGPLVLGVPPDADTVTVSLDGGGSDERWRLSCDGVDLTVSAIGAAAEHPEEGFDQLARVEGKVTVSGDEYPVSSLGWRAVHADQLIGGRLGSFRQVAAWFEQGEGLALLALRPKSARGQEGDELTAAVLGLENSPAVVDPRLSTTYAGDGRPARAGLELWVGDEEEQYPHRSAGEATGVAAAWAVGALDLHAQLFSWYSRGEQGAGIYLMGTAR